MTNEFKLSFTATEINARLGEIENLAQKAELPTKISDLINDSGFISDYIETDPTVPDWAKEPTKPNYTAEEVGALPDTTVIPEVPVNVSAFANDVGYLTEHQSLADYAKTDELGSLAFKDDLTASDVGADASGTASSAITSHNTSINSHNDIRDVIGELTTRLNALADSDDTTLDQMSEIVAYIKSNKTLIEDITTNKVNVSNIINNLTTNIVDKPLSAAQGVELKSLIDALDVDKLDVSELTPAINAALAQAKASGEFDGYTPVRGTDYWTDADKAEIKSYVDEAILGGAW
jgi:hypothetical protein